MKLKSIKFPSDEQAHDCPIEWWYFNGRLKDSKNNEFSFMNCLFKFDTDSIEFPLVKRIPLIKRTPFKEIFSGHHLISDLKSKNFYPFMEYVVLASKDSFSKPLLFINYANPIVLKGYFNSVIEETKKFEYFIKTENMELNLKSIKPPLLVGGQGIIEFGPKKTYYYSLTNMETSGRIKVKNKWVEVTGKSWMDHQWTYVPTLKGLDDKWLWFSIQLDNETEIVCFEYDDSHVKTLVASISNPDGSQEHTNQIKITPLRKTWTSPKTKVEYHLSYKIEIPSKDISLVVSPAIKNQEMCFGSLNYWEGPLNVEGKYKKKNVKGSGFLEIVGRPFQIGNAGFLIKSSFDVAKQVYADSRSMLFGF